VSVSEISMVVGVHDVIVDSNFGFNISGVSDLQGVEISVFLLTLLVIVTAVLMLPRSL